ncbi:MAG: hypothetical protein JWM74_2482 [Myxococcaceae bacterium]|nr:hypothetical protein [Myxococcaceae bacterium]
MYDARVSKVALLATLAATVGACATSTRSADTFEPAVDAAPPPPAVADAGVAPSFVADTGTGSSEPLDCKPCLVTGPGTFCGVQVDIQPYVTGGPFGGFQSQAGTGYQTTVTVTLSQPLRWVSVKILDPDFPGNFIRTHDDQGQLIDQLAFDSDGAPNVLTDSTKGVGTPARPFKQLEFVPDPQDYVAYDELTIVPAGCSAPIK